MFDITLSVTTKQEISQIYNEPDIAVVVVMDISNTMNSNFGDKTRYEAAMTAAESFIDKFTENNSLGVSKIGYVAFNTDAHEIFGLQSCTSADTASQLKNSMRSETGNIINSTGYEQSHSRFTNIEAGLKMASDMLSGVSNRHKYIIFLSDGFPTTYISSGYSGYDPYCTGGTPGNDGVFYDYVTRKYCKFGTSYSDKAAVRAREMATSIKSSGATIFSIGVDVGGQTIKKYIDQTVGKDYSVVDRTGETYEIGSADSSGSYNNWLKNSIGSGYYYDSTDTAGLQDAYNKIFENIQTEVSNAAEADWVANDPIPVTQGQVGFIQFYNKENTPVNGGLTGSGSENAENTASFNQDNSVIRWDLKNSGYTLTQDGSTTWYTYTLVYRVRLTNEKTGFIENQVYDTNGETTLTYRVTNKEGDYVTISQSKELIFPIPSVHGFLGEFEFTKQALNGSAIPGAVFTLKHDETKCRICNGDGTPVRIDERTAASDENGRVVFSGVPSGHKYTLDETTVPPGYSPNGFTYEVEVAYDIVTIKAKDSSGSNVEWDGIIVNTPHVELPTTGAAGSLPYISGGTALILIALSIIFISYRRGDD